MLTKKIFLASSSELKDQREQFEIFLYRKGKLWKEKGIYLELIIWEDFIDAMSGTRLQDEYNKAIKDCDIFVMLFHTKVGKYTQEEFETAFQTFQEDGKPLVYTYFNTSLVNGTSSERDQQSLQAFKEKLRELGHFKTEYDNIDQLKFHFSDQLDKLDAKGFFKEGTTSSATQTTTKSNTDNGKSIIGEIKGKIPFSQSLVDLLNEYHDALMEIDPSSENELLLFKARFNKLDQDIRMGITSESNATIRRNQLNYSLMNILDNFERMAKNK